MRRTQVLRPRCVLPDLENILPAPEAPLSQGSLSLKSRLLYCFLYKLSLLILKIKYSHYGNFGKYRRTPRKRTLILTYKRRVTVSSFGIFPGFTNNNHNHRLSGFYLPGRHCAKCFPRIITFHSHYSPKRLDMILFSFYKRENRGSVRLTTLPSVPGLVAELGLKFRCDSSIHFCKQELL